MVDLYLLKTNNKDHSKAYKLAIRDFGGGTDVEWTTLCYMDAFSADRLNGEKISYWSMNDEPEEIPAVQALRLEHPSLREAWDNYQVLKKLVTPNK